MLVLDLDISLCGDSFAFVLHQTSRQFSLPSLGVCLVGVLLLNTVYSLSVMRKLWEDYELLVGYWYNML